MSPMWIFQSVNKIQKETQRINARVANPRNRNMSVFANLFGRAGEDDKQLYLGERISKERSKIRLTPIIISRTL